MEECERKKHHPRDKELVNNLKTRLNRVIGQLNGVNNMIACDRYCSDILVQLAAAKQALKEIGYMILEDHMKTCVVDDIKQGDTSSLEEAIHLSKRLY